MEGFENIFANERIVVAGLKKDYSRERAVQSESERLKGEERSALILERARTLRLARSAARILANGNVSTDIEIENTWARQESYGLLGRKTKYTVESSVLARGWSIEFKNGTRRSIDSYEARRNEMPSPMIPGVEGLMLSQDGSLQWFDCDGYYESIKPGQVNTFKTVNERSPALSEVNSVLPHSLEYAFLADGAQRSGRATLAREEVVQSAIARRLIESGLA